MELWSYCASTQTDEKCRSFPYHLTLVREKQGIFTATIALRGNENITLFTEVTEHPQKYLEEADRLLKIAIEKQGE